MGVGIVDGSKGDFSWSIAVGEGSGGDVCRIEKESGVQKVVPPWELEREG